MIIADSCFQFIILPVSNPPKYDAVPEETSPLGIPRDAEPNRVLSRLQNVSIDLILEESPLSADLSRAVESRITRQDILAQRAVDLPVNIDIKRRTLRVASQRHAQKRSPVSGDIAGREIKFDRPLSDGRRRKVPVRVLGLTDDERQVRRAVGRHAMLVRHTAVLEPRRLLVELADLEDALAAGNLPRELAEVHCLVL